MEALKTKHGRDNALAKSNSLLETAARLENGYGIRERASELITDANKERYKAGLIKGDLLR